MSAAVSHKRSLVDGTDRTSYTTTAFTPNNNELLVVFVYATGTLANDATVTDSQGNTYYMADRNPVAAAHSLYCFIANALVTNTSMTVTFDCSSDGATGCAILVEGVTSMKTAVGSAAVRQINDGKTGAGVAPAVVLPAATLSQNPILGAVGNAANPATLTQPSGWAELADTGYTVPTTGAESASLDSGGTAATITWGSTSASAHGEIAVELAYAHEVNFTPKVTASTAVAPTIKKNVAITNGSETDAAQTMTHKKNATLTPAAEADAAQAMTHKKNTTITPATEADAAVAVARSKHVALTAASELDVAQALTMSKRFALTAAIELDAGQTLAMLKRAVLAPAAESDAGVPLVTSKHVVLVGAISASLAVPVTITKHLTTTPAAELDSALAPTIEYHRALTPATEADTAIAQVIRKLHAFTPATELDAAVAMTTRKVLGLTPALEADEGEALALSKVHTLAPAGELDTARALILAKSIVLTPADEIDTAEDLTYFLAIVRALEAAIEIDSASGTVLDADTYTDDVTATYESPTAGTYGEDDDAEYNAGTAATGEREYSWA